MLIIFVGKEERHFAAPFQSFKWFGLFPTDLVEDRNSRRNMPSDATEGAIATPATAGYPLGRRRCLDWGLPTMT